MVTSVVLLKKKCCLLDLTIIINKTLCENKVWSLVKQTVFTVISDKTSFSTKFSIGIQREKIDM